MYILCQPYLYILSVITSDQNTFPVLKLKSTAQADLVLLMTDVRIFLSSDRLRISFFWLNSRDGWPLVALHLVWSFGSFGTDHSHKQTI